MSDRNMREMEKVLEIRRKCRMRTTKPLSAREPNAQK